MCALHLSSTVHAHASLVCATWCVCEELVGHVSQREDGNHTVVTIGFNEVVASDGGRIDVVLPEWTNKCLQRGRERD